MCLLGLLLSASLVLASAPKGPWDTFNYSPESRTVHPTSVVRQEGTVQNVPENLSETDEIVISGDGSWFTLDFGKEVSSQVSLR